MRPEASQLVTLGIPLLSLLVVAAVALAVRACSVIQPAHAARFVLGVCVWLTFTGALAHSGFFAQLDALPPRMLLIVVPIVALPILVSRSSLGHALARELPMSMLVGFHAFRLPLELVMHEAAIEGTMPSQMTFTGWNFDIVTGVTAVVVAVLAAYGRAPRWLLLGWNALGSLLLFVVVAIAISSLPMFAVFGREPSQLNTWVAYFPFVWLPAALVASAFFGHLVLWRRLLAPRSGT